MIVRFFRHGDGSGQAAVDYLMAAEVPKFDENRNRTKGEVVRRDPLPECLEGDPEQMALLIDSGHRKWRYTSLVVAFADDDSPSNDEQRAVITSFEQAAFAGLASDQTKTLWVRHVHMGNVELHCLVLRQELYDGRALNIAPPGSEPYFNAWRDFWNAKMGWADPEAIEHKRQLREVLEGKDRTEIREFIHGMVIEGIENGVISNHADVRAYLQTFEKDAGLEIKPLTEKQIARRTKQDEQAKAGGKPRPPEKRITMRQVGATSSAETFRLEDRIYHEHWTAAEYFAGKAAKESSGTDERKPRPTPERVEELRRAMESAIDKRAAKNSDRYGRPASNGRAAPQPDESEDRSRTFGDGDDDTESGQGFELHTLEDGDADRRIIDVGGVRRRARRFRNLRRNESRTAAVDSAASPSGFEREQSHARHWRPWDRHTTSKRRRDDSLPDWSSARSRLHQETVEEQVDERWSDSVRERIVALRRRLAEADRAVGRTLEKLWRYAEALGKRIAEAFSTRPIGPKISPVADGTARQPSRRSSEAPAHGRNPRETFEP